MKAKARTGSLCLNVVEKNERLEQLAQITGTHQPCNRTMSLATGAGNDSPFFIHHGVHLWPYLLRNEGMPNGVAMTARNQMTGPLTLAALSSITPEVTKENRKVRSQMPMTKRPMK